MFQDRREAGRLLAAELPANYLTDKSMIIAIAKGGIPVGCAMSITIRLPVDIIFSCRIPMIGNPHIGVGAITASGEKAYNTILLAQYGLKSLHFESAEEEAVTSLNLLMKELRGSSNLPFLYGKTILLVDDGISSGYTMLVSIRCVKRHGAKQVVVAVPVSSFSGYKLVKEECDDFIAMRICSEPSFSIESFYKDSKIDLEKAKECINIARSEGVAVF